MASTEPSDHDELFSHLLPALVRTDPQSAARLAECNTSEETRALILHRVAQLWADRDPVAALKWTETLECSGERDALVTDVCLRLGENNPAEAIHFLTERISGEHPHGGLEALARRWAGTDFPAAREWALSSPPGWRRDRIVAGLAIHQAQESPLDAATLVANEIPEGAPQTEAMIAVLHQWAQSDPGAASAWLALFPKSAIRTRAILEIENLTGYSAPPATKQ